MRPALSTAISGAAFFFAFIACAELGRAAPPEKPAAAAGYAPVRIFGLELNAGARLTFLMADRQPNVTVRQVPDGVEVRTEESAGFQIANMPSLREISGIDIVTEDGNANIARIHLTGNYDIQEQRLDNKVRVDLVQKASSASDAKPAVTAPPVKAAFDLEGLRAGMAEKLAALKDPAPQAAAPAAPKAPSETAVAAGAAAQPAAVSHRPACPPDFATDGWKGEGSFSERLRTLHNLTAQSQETPSALAMLAEFYLFYGLGPEALAVTQEVKQEGISNEDRRRVQRDADIARLLKAQPISSASVLLNSPPECDRTDIPLWRALSAAASGDQEALRRDGEAAGYALQYIPEPLSGILAYRIAEAGNDDLTVLRAMAGAVRHSDSEEAANGASRFMIQARIAHARKDPAEEVNFLEHASHDVGVTGLKAIVRLAELRSAQDDSEGRQSEAMLADAARVYRDTAFGQSAAAALSETRLRHGDYAGALEVANDSSADHIRQADSRAATLAARVLRQLLVEKDVAGLPSSEQRLLIYWRYGGYATPGEKGDDIRLGAAQLMLDKDMPEAALDVMRQVSAQSPQSALLHATAEARAGNPEAALTLLKSIPPDNAGRRIAAEALARMGKPVEAAHQLDGLEDPSDQTRRASLFYAAKEWSDASSAYADLLQNPSLGKEARVEAADRYALAVALSGKQPAADRTGYTGLAQHIFGALPEKAGGPQPPVPAIRESLRRAGQIEAILPPSGPDISASGG